MPQFKSIIFLICLFVTASAAFSQKAPGKISEILSAAEKNEHRAAIASIENLRRTEPEIFTANEFDYLLARLLLRAGDQGAAAANFEAVVRRDSVLKNYALWHLSQIMRSSGNLLMERIYLRKLFLTFENSLLRDAARKRLARSFFESENFPEAIELLETGTATGKTLGGASEKNFSPGSENLAREDSVLLGRAYLFSNRKTEARRVFEKLVDDLPNKNQPDDFALAGVKGLDLLETGEENFGERVASLSAAEHFKRAEIYQFNRNFHRARLHYKALAENHPSDEKAALAMYQTGRGFGQERNYEKALEWFERVRSKYPENELAKAALYQSADASANLENTGEAVQRYRKYIAENPDAGNLVRAYLNIIDAYRDAGDFSNALQWTLKMQTDFPGERETQALAVFARAKIQLSREDWRAALPDFDQLLALGRFGGDTAGGTNKLEIEFLRGFALEKLGRFDEAIEQYLKIDDGLKNYYGWRATERLNELGKDKRSAELVKQNFRKFSQSSRANLTSETASEIKNAAQTALRLTADPVSKELLFQRIESAYALLPEYRNIPAGKIADFERAGKFSRTPEKSIDEKSNGEKNSNRIVADKLLFLGLYDEGTPELEKAFRKDLSKNTGSLGDFPFDTAFALAVFYKRGDLAHRSIGFIEGFWRKIPGDFQIELVPREHLELLYPKPFEAALLRYGREKQVDPRFILSIMRQESRFIADVKSNAAARGLMQFISTTADKMANEMKIENFRQDDLYDPPTAIRFGSHYVAGIFRDFPAQPWAVAASYNAGEDRMMRWFKRSRSNEPDRYVPEVAFGQTKDYVYKVMANYRVYRMIYDENLRDLPTDSSLR